MADVEDLKIILRAEVDKAIADLKRASREGKNAEKDWQSIADTFQKNIQHSLSLKNAFSQLTMQIAGGLAIYDLAAKGIRAIGQFAADSIKEFTEAAESHARLAAQIKATGGAAGFTAEQLEDMASRLQDSTRIEAEEINKAQSALLKFTNITGEQFIKATELSLDLAVAMGSDASGAAQTLGKALEDPISGMSSLRRAGVMLSDDQEKLARSFAEAGNNAKAQEIILKALQDRIGGVAAAVGKEDPAGMKRLQLAIKDVKQEIGELLATNAKPFLNALATDIENFRKRLAGDKKASAEVLQVVKFGDLIDTGDISGVRKAIQDLSGKVNKEIIKAWIEEAKKRNPLATQAQAAAIRAAEEELANMPALTVPSTSGSINNDADTKAQEHIKAVNDELNKNIQVIKLRAAALGQEVNQQDIVNAYVSAYVKLISESGGLITENNAAAKSLLSQIKALRGETTKNFEALDRYEKLPMQSIQEAAEYGRAALVEEQKVKNSVYTNMMAAENRYSALYKQAADERSSYGQQALIEDAKIQQSVYANMMAAEDRYAALYKNAEYERAAYGQQLWIKDEKVKNSVYASMMAAEDRYSALYKQAADERSSYGQQALTEDAKIQQSVYASMIAAEDRYSALYKQAADERSSYGQQALTEDAKIQQSVYASMIAAEDRYSALYKQAADERSSYGQQALSEDAKIQQSVYASMIAAEDRYSALYKQAADERSSYGQQTLIEDERVRQSVYASMIAAEGRYSALYKQAADERSSYGQQTLIEDERVRQSVYASMMAAEDRYSALYKQAADERAAYGQATLIKEQALMAAWMSGPLGNINLKIDGQELLLKIYGNTKEALIQQNIELLKYAKGLRDSAIAAGESSEKIAKLDAIIRTLTISIEGFDPKTFFDDLKKQAKETAESVMTSGLYEVFSSIGEAMASGANSADAAEAAMRKFFQTALQQTSMLALNAGLKLLVEGGLPMLPIALGLFALAGISGIAAGAIGAAGGIRQTDYDQYIVNPIVDAETDLAKKRVDIIKQQLEDEKKLRDENLKKIEESFNTEYEVLKDQWQRGLISTEQYKQQSASLRSQEEAEKAEANKPVEEAEALLQQIENARTQKLSYLATEAKKRQDELNAMSGWDKFWSGRDEELVAELDVLDARIKKVKEAQSLAEISAAKYGADFITQGPKLMLVGDNPGGREHVRVEPLGTPNRYGPQPEQLVINITGDVYGIDDLYQKLELAGRKLLKAGRARTGVFA